MMIVVSRGGRGPKLGREEYLVFLVVPGRHVVTFTTVRLRLLATAVLAPLPGSTRR